MMLRPFPITSNAFIFNGTRVGVAEISQLQGQYRFTTEKVFDDAVDEGFTVVSKKTGREVVMYLKSIRRDAEGDIQFWVFEPASARQRAENNFTIKIYNT